LEEPEQFLPEGLVGWQPDPFAFVPQEGGDPSLAAAVFPAAEIAYAVPEPDLSIDAARLPALPRSGLVITNVLPQN
jgi:fatty-acid peroxygenase